MSEENGLKKVLMFCAVSLLAVSCGSGPRADSAAMVQSATNQVVEADVNAVVELLGKDSAVKVLDIRTPGEYAAGHIDGAINIDYHAQDFATQIAALDRSTTYVLHCASGGRSRWSLSVFKDMGFQKIVHLSPGFNAWARAGQPVQR